MSAPVPLLTFRHDAGVVHIEGVLDELAQGSLAQLGAALAGQKAIVLEVGELRRINSLGVRAWCDFMKKLGNRPVTFRRCSPAFVDQLNSVSDFRGHATIESFIAPYVCERSGNVFYEELTVGKDVKKGDVSTLAGRPCKECPEPLVFDDLPERYMHFLLFL